MTSSIQFTTNTISPAAADVVATGTALRPALLRLRRSRLK